MVDVLAQMRRVVVEAIGAEIASAGAIRAL